MRPLNLNDVWNVTRTGPTMPQKMWTSSQRAHRPGPARAAPTRLRTA